MSEIPPAGTPVDQRLYNEACRRVMALDHRVAELEAELNTTLNFIDSHGIDREDLHAFILAAQEYDGTTKTHQEF